MSQAVTEQDPFGATVNESDPFATEEEGKAGGGAFEPTPKVPDLAGRLVAFIPREFTDKAPKDKKYQKNADDIYQDRYTVDLVVLDGGDLEFYAKVKDGDTLKETEIVIPASELPKMWEKTWIFQMALIGQLKKRAGAERPILLGVVRRGPIAKDRAKEDFDSIEAKWNTWAERPPARRGEEPSFSWQVDTAVTPDQRRIALEWWNSVKDSIKL